jgi:hypothetical protein
MGGSAHPHLCFLSSALAMVLTAAGTLALCTSRCFLGLSAHTPSVVLDEVAWPCCLPPPPLGSFSSIWTVTDLPEQFSNVGVHDRLDEFVVDEALVAR